MGIISFKYGLAYFSLWEPYLTAIGSHRYNQRVKQCCAFLGTFLVLTYLFFPKYALNAFCRIICCVLLERVNTISRYVYDFVDGIV